MAVVLYFFDREADAVMGEALIDGESGGEGGLYPEGLVGAAGIDGEYFSEGFDDSGKHRGLISEF